MQVEVSLGKQPEVGGQEVSTPPGQGQGRGWEQGWGRGVEPWAGPCHRRAWEIRESSAGWSQHLANDLGEQRLPTLGWGWRSDKEGGRNVRGEQGDLQQFSASM